MNKQKHPETKQEQITSRNDVTHLITNYNLCEQDKTSPCQGEHECGWCKYELNKQEGEK